VEVVGSEGVQEVATDTHLEAPRVDLVSDLQEVAATQDSEALEVAAMGILLADLVDFQVEAVAVVFHLAVVVAATAAAMVTLLAGPVKTTFLLENRHSNDFSFFYSFTIFYTNGK